MNPNLSPGLPCLDALKEILSPDPDTNFLANLITSPQGKFLVSNELSNSLYQKLLNDSLSFKSIKEIRWSIEILGYALVPPFVNNMPKEKENIIDYPIKKTLKLYSYILLAEVNVSSNRQTIRKIDPKPVLNHNNPDHQKLCKEMLSHLTLVFDRKNFEKKNKTDNDDLLVYSNKYCIHALKIYLKFMEKYYKNLNNETWEYIIKLLIGLGDYILAGYSDKYLRIVIEGLIVAIFHAWIYSGLQSKALWTMFSNTLKDWLFHESFIMFWADISLALTKKNLVDLKCFPLPKFRLKDKNIIENQNFLVIIYRITKDINADSKIKSSCIESQNVLNITKEHAIFLWQKFLTLLDMSDDPQSHRKNSLLTSDSGIYYLFIEGISNVVAEILKIGKLTSSKKEQTSEKYKNSKYFVEYSIDDSKYTALKSGEVRPRRKSGIDLEDKTSKLFDKGNEDTSDNRKRNQFPASHSMRPVLNMDLKQAGSFFWQMKSLDIGENHFETEDKTRLEWRVMKNKTPSGPNILEYFGKWLFEAASLEVEKFDVEKTESLRYEGVITLAVSTLCRIFSESRGNFEDYMLKDFYSILYSYLKMENVTNEQLCVVLKIIPRILSSTNMLHNVIIHINIMKRIQTYISKIKPLKENFVEIDYNIRKYMNNIFTNMIVYHIELDQFNQDNNTGTSNSANLNTNISNMNMNMNNINNNDIFNTPTSNIGSASMNNYTNAPNPSGTPNNNAAVSNNNKLIIKSELQKSIENILSLFKEIYDMIYKKCPEKINEKLMTQQQQNEMLLIYHASWNYLILCLFTNKLCDFVLFYHELAIDKYSGLMKLYVELLLFAGEFSLIRLQESENIFVINDISRTGTSIIEKLRNFLENKMKEITANKQAYYALKNVITTCIGALYTWLLLLPSFKDTKNIKSQKLNAALKVLLSVANSKEEIVKDCAAIVINNLMHAYGKLNMGKNSQFFGSIYVNPKGVSGDKKPKDVYNDLEAKTYFTFGLNDNTIVSLLDLESDTKNEDIMLLIRNMNGKFLWQGELFYKLYNPYEDNESSTKMIEKNMEAHGTPRLSTPGLSHIMSNVNSKKSSPKSGDSINFSIDVPNLTHIAHNQKEDEVKPSVLITDLDVLIEKQMKIEEANHKKATNPKKEDFLSDFKSSDQILLQKKEENVKNSKKVKFMTKATTFLSGLGLLNPRNINNLAPIKNDETTKESIRKLDSQPDRNQINVALIYLPSPYSDKITKTPIIDERYQGFVESLGTLVNQDTLELGIYESIRGHVNKHKILRYFSTILTEICFLLPNLPEAEELDAVLKACGIVILWNARIIENYDQKFPNFLNLLNQKYVKVVIIITPIEDQCYKLVIKRKDLEKCLYPPFKEILIPRSMLANFICQLSMNLDREIKSKDQKTGYHEAYFNNIQERKKQQFQSMIIEV